LSKTVAQLDRELVHILAQIRMPTKMFDTKIDERAHTSGELFAARVVNEQLPAFERAVEPLFGHRGTGVREVDHWVFRRHEDIQHVEVFVPELLVAQPIDEPFVLAQIGRFNDQHV
jgi:hypothetical protein